MQKIFLRSIPTIKVLLVLLIIYLIGFIKGLILCYIMSLTYNFLMLKFYKLEPFNLTDLLFVWNEEDDEFNLVGLFIMDEFDPEKLKEVLIERGLKKYKKLRSVQEYKFFDWWWKEISVEECLNPKKYNPVEIIYNTKIKFNVKEDLINFATECLKTKLDMKKELPYRFTIIKNDEGEIKNVFMIKFDHSLMDGMSFISLITSLSDNKLGPHMFPGGIRKTISLWQRFLMFILFPFYFLYPLYRNLHHLRSGITPFKGVKTGKSNLMISDKFDFAFYAKITKKLKITFNDLIMSVWSVAMNKYFRDNNFVCPETITTVIPVAQKFFPQKREDLIINNSTTGLCCELILINDVVKDCYVIKKEFQNHIRNPMLVKFSRILADLMVKTCPHYLSLWVVKFVSINMDITLSNVPGPKEILRFGDCKMKDMIPCFTPGMMNTFIGTMTYAGHFRMTIAMDNCLKIDLKNFMSYVENELNHLKIYAEQHFKEN